MVIGLYNYSGTGVFITPFFLNYYIFLGVAIWFWIKSILQSKSTAHDDGLTPEKSSSILGIYALGLAALTITHSLTINTLANLFKIEALANFEVQPLYKLIAIVFFFTTLFWIELKRLKTNRQNILNWIPLALILTSFIFTLGNYHIAQSVFLSLYMIGFILSLKQKSYQNKLEWTSLGYQFVLFLILENIRFLSML